MGNFWCKFWILSSSLGLRTLISGHSWASPMFWSKNKSPTKGLVSKGRKWAEWGGGNSWYDRYSREHAQFPHPCQGPFRRTKHPFTSIECTHTLLYNILLLICPYFPNDILIQEVLWAQRPTHCRHSVSLRSQYENTHALCLPLLPGPDHTFVL